MSKKKEDIKREWYNKYKEEKNMKFVCYEKCSTCKKAKQWLSDNNLEVEVRDIKGENPSFKEIKQWHKESGLPLKRFFNTSGLKYRELKLSERLEMMSEKEQMELLATDGMLVKRPLLVAKNKVLVGFKEKEWKELLKKE